MSTGAQRRLFFYELCRLCLENEGTCDVFQHSDLVEDIFACTGVKVNNVDNLPHKICIKCSKIVESWKQLRLLATKNEAHLRTLFGGAQDDSDCESDIVQLNRTTSTATTTCVAPSKPEAAISENDDSFISQRSSKEILCLLLKEGEKRNQTSPVIRQTISLRKDLFPPSYQCKSAAKRKSPAKQCHPHKLLKVKVEQETKLKKIKFDDDEEIAYYCEECDKSFDKYKKLYLHQRLHNKKICCPLDACGKKFATKGDMEKHIRTHTGERPFQCTLCDKSFSQRVSLRQHVAAVHSADSNSSS